MQVRVSKRLLLNCHTKGIFLQNLEVHCALIDTEARISQLKDKLSLIPCRIRVPN